MVLRLISFNSLIVPPPVPPAPHSRVPPSSGPTSLQQMHGDGHCSHQLKMAGGGGHEAGYIVSGPPPREQISLLETPLAI